MNWYFFPRNYGDSTRHTRWKCWNWWWWCWKMRWILFDGCTNWIHAAPVSVLSMWLKKHSLSMKMWHKMWSLQKRDGIYQIIIAFVKSILSLACMLFQSWFFCLHFINLFEFVAGIVWTGFAKIEIPKSPPQWITRTMPPKLIQNSWKSRPKYFARKVVWQNKGNGSLPSWEVRPKQTRRAFNFPTSHKSTTFNACL